MLTEIEAAGALLMELPGVEIAAKARYNDLYIFRVVFPTPFEADFDPFFSVNVDSGEVNEFSVLEDGDISEIAAAFNDSQGGSDG